MSLLNINPVNFIVVSMSSRLLLYTVAILKEAKWFISSFNMNDFK